MPKEIYKKVYLVITALVGICLCVAMLLMTSSKKANNVIRPVGLYFENISSSGTDELSLKLKLNPNSQNISFVRVGIFFDESLMQLSKEVSVDGSLLKKLISITNMEESNQNGNIEIVLAQEPDTMAPNIPFDLANLSFTKTSTEEGEIVIIEEDTQVVDSNSKEFPFKANF